MINLFEYQNKVDIQDSFEGLEGLKAWFELAMSRVPTPVQKGSGHIDAHVCQYRPSDRKSNNMCKCVQFCT